MFDTYIATSTAFANDVGLTLFNGVFDVLYFVIPYAIGFFLLWVGLSWVKRAIGGRM